MLHTQLDTLVIAALGTGLPQPCSAFGTVGPRGQDLEVGQHTNFVVSSAPPDECHSSS